MLTALYYPHTKLTNPNLIKNSLLLWDKIEYIVPNRYWKLLQLTDDPTLDRARALVAKPHVPTAEEKQLAHEAIVELANSTLPDWFFVDKVSDSLKYELYEGKFLKETWRALEASQLARPNLRGHRDFQTSLPFGLTMMSILADVCAGSQKQPITDKTEAYSAINRYVTHIGGGDLNKLELTTPQDRLVGISVKLIDPQVLDLNRLIALREREEAGEHQLRTLRHNFLKKVREHAERVALEPKHGGDVQELERVYEQEMAADLAALQDELKVEKSKLALTKEIVIGVLALGGTLAGWALGLADIAQVGGVLTLREGITVFSELSKRKIEFNAARNKTLQGHVMSWLYV